MSTHKTESSSKTASNRSLEQEMIIAAILWLMVAGSCVIAANAWAMGA